MNKALFSFKLAPLFLLLNACAPATPPTQKPQPVPPVIFEAKPLPQIPKSIVAQKPLPKPTALPSENPKHPLKAQTFSAQGINFSVVSFDRRDHDLIVNDQPGGPGSEYENAEEAGRGNLAAINAGFFTPEGEPLGLVVTKGRKRGSLNRASSLGTGFFMGPKASLISRAQYLSSQPEPSELLQSGPRLLWSGESLTGLSDKDQRPRSFLLWDGKDHFALGYVSSASLLGLSNALKSQPISGFMIAYALNLDGG